MLFEDLPAERAILAGVCRYGSDAYFDICDIVDENSFTLESNISIYSCLKHILERDDTAKPDIPLILSAAKEIGISDFFNNQEVMHLSSIMKLPVLLSNVRYFAAKVRKLQIAHMMYEQL